MLNGRIGLKKFENRLNHWRTRTLSLKDKAMIIKMSEWVYTRITKAIWKVLWNGKTELVKRDLCRMMHDPRSRERYVCNSENQT